MTDYEQKGQVATDALKMWLTRDERVCRHIYTFIENEWDKAFDDNFIDKNEFVYDLIPNLRLLVTDEVLETIGTTALLSGFIRSSMLTVLNDVDWKQLTEALVDESDLFFDTGDTVGAESNEQRVGSVQG